MSIDTIRQIRNSIVAIAVGRVNEHFGVRALLHLGTGFCIKRGNIFLSCNHVFNNTREDCVGLHVAMDRDNRGHCEVYHIICRQQVSNVDLVVFKVKAPIECFSPLELEDLELVPDGTEILLYGYPESITQWTSTFPNPQTNRIPQLSNPAMFSRGSVGIISAQYVLGGMSMIEHDVEIFPGLSGAPIIEIHNKKVVGIHQSHRPIGRREEYTGTKLAIGIQPYISQIEAAADQLANT